MKTGGYVLLSVLVIALAAAGILKFRGESGTQQPPGSPPGYIKVVPCKIRFGGVVADLEVDLNEVNNLVLDGKRLLRDILAGDPEASPPEKNQPVILVVNKKSNKFTYLRLTPHVKEVRLRTQEPGDVELIVKNQEPLQVELWVNSGKDVRMDVEFKDVMPANPK
jgi:hypothetical protein